MKREQHAKAERATARLILITHLVKALTLAIVRKTTPREVVVFEANHKGLYAVVDGDVEIIVRRKEGAA